MLGEIDVESSMPSPSPPSPRRREGRVGRGGARGEELRRGHLRPGPHVPAGDGRRLAAHPRAGSRDRQADRGRRTRGAPGSAWHCRSRSPTCSSWPTASRPARSRNASCSTRKRRKRPTPNPRSRTRRSPRGDPQAARAAAPAGRGPARSRRGGAAAAQPSAQRARRRTPPGAAQQAHRQGAWTSWRSAAATSRRSSRS